MGLVAALWLGGCGTRGGECGDIRCGVDQVCCEPECGRCIALDEECVKTYLCDNF